MNKKNLVFLIMLLLLISACAKEPIAKEKPVEKDITREPVKEEEIRKQEEIKKEEEYRQEERKVEEEKPIEETTPEPAPQTNLISPGDYPTITGIQPFLGNVDAPLKILFVNIDNAPHFNEIKNSIINDELRLISPFKENFNSISFYSINMNGEGLNCDCSGGVGLGGSGFACSNSALSDKIKQELSIDDLRGVIITAVVSTDLDCMGSGGDIIYVASKIGRDLEVQLGLYKNMPIHEIGHNFGLADLYYGIFYFDGRPSQFWPTNFSRSFLNVDGPGCPKWCASYKPVSEYTQSVSAQCSSFTNKQDCVSFGRDAEKSCTYTGEFSECCVWSEEPFEYFDANCAPAWGTENIGINCLGDSGCYFGAVYGNYAWRPVLRERDSLMYSPQHSNKFGAVSERFLTKVFECCFNQDSSSGCLDFRQEYSDFLENTNFKKRIGSCGYVIS